MDINSLLNYLVISGQVSIIAPHPKWFNITPIYANLITVLDIPYNSNALQYSPILF
jgi:hypothetical protein